MQNQDSNVQPTSESLPIGNAMLPAALSEGNATIGTYMGKNFTDPLNYMYDKSWDYLMEVVEKIHLDRMVKEVSIRPGRTRIWLHGFSYIQSPCKAENNSITECWLAVVEFIKWRNNRNASQR